MTWRRPTLPRLRTQYHRRSRVFTAEFGMGSGVWPLAMTTRSSEGRFQDPGVRIQELVRSRALSVPDSWSLVPGAWFLEPGSWSLIAGIWRLPHARKASLRFARIKAERAISTGQLHALLRFHTRPIDVVVYHGSSGRPGFEVGFPLRCLQRLSRPHIATRRCRWRDNRCTRGASIPVLSY
jgi:hypothetical protein